MVDDDDSNVLGCASLMAALGFAFVVLDMCVFFFSAAVSTKDSFRLWLEPLLLSLLKLNLDFDLGLPVGFVDEWLMTGDMLWLFMAGFSGLEVVIGFDSAPIRLDFRCFECSDAEHKTHSSASAAVEGQRAAVT
jgi:hypothetical protein